MEPSFANGARDSLFEGAIEAATMQGSRTQLSSFRKIEECAKHSRSTHLAVRRYVGGGDRRKHHTLLTGAGCKNIEAALSAISGYRAEIEKWSRLVWRHSVANRNENHVPLVTLDRFEILDKQSLPFWHEPFDIRTYADPIDHVIHRIALLS